VTPVPVFVASHAHPPGNSAHRSSGDANFLHLDDRRGDGRRTEVTVVVMPVLT
jgi:hypothetical protein